jgi:AcrR family transcriptional regulator
LTKYAKLVKYDCLIKVDKPRLSGILDTALSVFIRHGFAKTSFEDLARAASISRQGLYLHYKNKDEIFSAAVTKYLEDGLQSATTVLCNENLRYETRLVRSLDEWYGRTAGLLQPDASDLMPHCERLIGDLLHSTRDQFQKHLARLLATSTTHKSKELTKRAIVLAEMLMACGLTWKHQAISRENLLVKFKKAGRVALIAMQSA